MKLKALLKTILLGLCTIAVANADETTVKTDIQERPMNTYTQITQEEAMHMMTKNDGHIILEVRRPDEYAIGHIPGAILIPNETVGTTPPDELRILIR